MARPRAKVSDKQIAALPTLYKRLGSWEKVAEHLGIALSTVLHHRDQKQVPKRQYRRFEEIPRREKRRVVTEFRKHRSLRKVWQVTGIRTPVVQKILHEQGVPTGRVNERQA